MPLKLKLWLGRFVGWDKRALRLLLLMLAICFVVAATVTIDLANSDPDCDSECQQLVDDTVDRHFPDIDRIVNDSFREVR